MSVFKKWAPVSSHIDLRFSIIENPRYRYMLLSNIFIDTSVEMWEILQDKDIAQHDFYTVLTDYDCSLKISEGYAWDGVTGPFPTTASSLRATLFHDTCYQAMRHNPNLGKDFRKACDKRFKEILAEDGENVIVRNLMYIAVRLFGKVTR